MSQLEAETAQNFLSVEDANEPGFRWTAKRHAFVHFYVQLAGNGTDAARKAGYSEHVLEETSAELLTHKPIREAIKRLLAVHLRRLGVSDDDIIAKWISWAETDVGDYVTEVPVEPLLDDAGQPVHDARGRLVYDPNGRTIKAAARLDRLTKEQRQRIKSIAISNNQFGQNVKLEFHDAQKAIDRLAEWRGIISKEGLGGGVTADDIARSVRDALTKMDEADGLK